MTEADFLQHLVAQLEQAGISFMVSSSLASGYHGEPRATYDIDIIIEAGEDQVRRLSEGLSERCYVSEAAAVKAARRCSMFNVIDLLTGIKADLILRKNRPFSRKEFERRQPAAIAGVSAFVVSAEDSILSKLERSKLGESERQYRDALNVACVSAERLDVAYLQEWAAELSVEDLLQSLLTEADIT